MALRERMPPELAEIPYGFKNLWVIRVDTYDIENSTFPETLITGVALNGFEVVVPQMIALYDYNRDPASLHVEADGKRLFVTLTAFAEGVFSFQELAGAPDSSGYTLPIATATTLGGVKVGDNLSIADDGTLSADMPDVSGFAMIAQLDAEATTRAAADELLDASVTAVSEEVGVLRDEVESIVIPDVSGLASKTALAAETTARTEADAALRADIDAIVVPDISGLATKTALQTEVTARGTADTALQAAIDAVVSFPEAPTDGRQYARRNAAWATVVGGGGEGSDGTTFTPAVSDIGIISWTNDGGLPNPSPINIKGADGATGSQGIQGVAGADGADGAQGIQGAQGLQGERGADGNDGAPGIQGAKGDTGAQGIQGLQGIQGEQGERGPQGEPGANGTQGLQGERGEQGIPGQQGIQGPTGAKGATGATGPKGDPGTEPVAYSFTVSAKAQSATQTFTGMAQVTTTSSQVVGLAMNATAAQMEAAAKAGLLATSQATGSVTITALRGALSVAVPIVILCLGG